MSVTKTALLQPVPYLNFNGNCAEAMHFYEQVFDAKIVMMLATKDTPFADQLPADFADKILNARLDLAGGGILYAGDCPPHIPYEGIKGVNLTFTLDTVAEAKDIYDKLVDGGEISMPFGPTFWAEGFGMITDKFGVTWAINGAMTYSG